MTEFKNQRVLITGAASTARVIAETFRDAGASVMACDINEEAVQSLVTDNPDIHAMVANVGSADDVSELVAAAQSKLGGVDILVNVVGIAGPTKATEEITTEEWQHTLDTNINSVFYTSRAVIPGMKERRHGVIVNFSSASTRTHLPNRSPYVASKYAVEGLTLNLARELGPFGVRANAILPGGIDNKRFRIILQRLAEERGAVIDEVAKRALRYVSMRTLIQPQEIADTVVFLCSDKACHITGQLIGVDGNLEWED